MGRSSAAPVSRRIRFWPSSRRALVELSGVRMPQLVGSVCVRCGKRVDSILEGKFCEVCGSPYHESCPQPEVDVADPSRCPACRSVRVIPARSSAGPAPSTGEIVLSSLRTFRAIRWLAGGLAIIALGAWLTLDPNLEGRV